MGKGKAAVYHFTDGSQIRPVIYQKELERLKEFAHNAGYDEVDVFVDKTLRKCNQVQLEQLMENVCEYKALILKDFYHLRKNTGICISELVRLGKAGIDGVELLELVVLGHAEELGHVVGQVHGVAAVNVDGLSGYLLHVVVEDFGVLLLLVGGEEEDGLQDVELLLPAEAGGEGVAVPGLALPGEGAHQILAGLAVHEVHVSLVVIFVGVWHGKSLPCIW